jgi:hypothetical protein
MCRNLSWVAFLIEKVGIEMQADRFRQLLHLFLCQACTKEREHYRRGLPYANSQKDEELVSLLLKTGAKEAILNEKDESYGNTPLHVACSLHSFGLIKLLILGGSDLSVTNLAGKTPVQVVDSEIETYLGYVDSNNSDIRDKTLARL